MSRLFKHITLLLLGVFLFPILFQSYHVVRHHSSLDNSETHVCACEITNADNGFQIQKESHKEKPCPICTYHFSINDLPRLSVSRLIIPAYTFTYIEIVAQLFFKQRVTKKSPRAPPVLLS